MISVVDDEQLTRALQLSLEPKEDVTHAVEGILLVVFDYASGVSVVVPEDCFHACDFAPVVRSNGLDSGILVDDQSG